MTRFDYKTEEDVRTILANCASLGANTVLFQVRGNADAYYRSSLEPWGALLGGKDPGYDPLETAIREARKHGMALHAWINVLPAWRGTTPPEDPEHVYNKHPDWIVVNQKGERQPLNEHYVALNPVLPEVQGYVAKIARDIAERYDIDGLHLDYIRFYVDDGGDYSYDERTLTLFGFLTGGTPKEKPEAWTAFRRAAVTETVAAIRCAVRNVKPGLPITAAVFPSVAGRKKTHQDAEGWAAAGLVDALFPMDYTGDAKKFDGFLEETKRCFSRVSAGAATVTSGGGEPLRTRAEVPVYPGIGIYRHKTVETTTNQIRRARESGARGFCFFSYAGFFPTDDATYKDEAVELRAARREAVRALLRGE